MKKFVKICLMSFLLIGVFGTVLCGTYVGINLLRFQSLPLNVQALSTPQTNIEVFDIENKPIKEENALQSSFCKLQNIPLDCQHAFLSIEDKNFYSHHGLNYKRMAGAMLKNIKERSLKEGASTISQQLIKNTHLSGEKTFERKFKEVALTKKLEKAFDKDEILESYLNIIFFGNNCYGIESASKYYFSKEPSALTLPECATLAGMIKSPSKYSPIHNPENALSRRNLVLSEMEKDGYISQEQKILAQKEPISLNIQKNSVGQRLNTFSQCAIDEASKLLGISAKQLSLGGYKIHTYQNPQKQLALQEALNKHEEQDVDYGAIVIDPEKAAVSAYCGRSDFKLMDCRRQPASCIKPLLVYAPALNEGIISPETQILDEKVTIGDYSPSNVNKKYGGYMSVTDAVKNSVNIPSIKVLSYIGIDTGKAYAEKLGINFDEQDDSYALALGGMTYGVNLKDLASAYTVFCNHGEFSKPMFVEYITDKNNKLVFLHKPEKRMVLREDSAYLMTNILQETAKSGTARKLSSLSNTEVAAKTGTVGKKNTQGNTDAYNIAFTPSEVVGVWYGSLENKAISIAGGNQPTEVARDYIGSQTYAKATFDVPSTVTEAEIDVLELEQNHRLVLASPYSPERYKKSALFSRFNMPSEVSQNFTDAPEINAKAEVLDGQAILTFSPQKHLVYQIFKDGILTQTIKDKSSPLTLRFSMPEEEINLKIVASYAALSADDGGAEKEFHLKRPKTATPKKSKWYI